MENNFTKQIPHLTANNAVRKSILLQTKNIVIGIIIVLSVLYFANYNNNSKPAEAEEIDPALVLADKQRAIEIRIKKAELQKQIEQKKAEAVQKELEAIALEKEKESLEPIVETPKKDEAVATIIEPQAQVVTAQLPNLVENYNKYKQYYSADNTCHPYIIASIHYRETNFGSTNAWNGQGAFQNLQNKYPANSEVSDWNEQVRQACLHLKGKVRVQTLLDINDEELIGKALARYNGCRGLVYTQCSYTVNKTEYMSVGTKCAVDGCAYTTTDNRFGALSIIRQLKNLNL
jgi:hypothetical protein